MNVSCGSVQQFVFQINVRQTMALGFLPLNEVYIAFYHLRNLMLVETPNIQNYITYFERQWIDRQKIHVDLNNIRIFDTRRVPMAKWNVFERDGHRTSNPCESFHSKLTRAMSGHNPNVFTFINKLKEFQVTSSSRNPCSKVSPSSFRTPLFYNDFSLVKANKFVSLPVRNIDASTMQSNN